MTWDRVDTFTTDEDDVQNAIFPPASEILFPIGEPDRRLGQHAFKESNLRGLSPGHTFTRVGDVDPLSVTPEVAGAKIVPERDFRVMGRPLV